MSSYGAENKQLGPYSYLTSAVKGQISSNGAKSVQLRLYSCLTQANTAQKECSKRGVTVQQMGNYGCHKCAVMALLMFRFGAARALLEGSK